MNSNNVSTHVYCHMEPLRTISLYLDGILMVPIISVNLLTIICCIRYHQLRTCTNAIIVSLATSDFLFGWLTILPGIWLRALDNYSDKFFCLFLMTISLASFLISLSNLTLLSFERYIAICRPFRYNIWITYRTTALSIASCWLVTLFLMLLLILFNKWTEELPCVNGDIIPYWLNSIILAITISTFVMSFWCYFRVMLVVKKQSQTVQSSTAGNCPVIGQVEMKKTIMMMIMFGLYLVFLLPVTFLKLAETRLPFSRNFATAKCLLVTLIKINCFTNFLVYNICNKLFRKAILHLLSCSRQPLRVPD